jgi:uncharacterized protein (TIGR03437 family)
MIKLNAIILGAAFASIAAAQGTIPADTSGNGMLQGAYNFRHIVYSTDANGSLTRLTATYGTLNFDGKGGYSLNGQMADSQTNSGQPQAYTVSSLTYGIGASGLGYLDNPLFQSEFVVGNVSQGVFLGSSTDGQINDILVAVPVGSSTPANSRLQGDYWVAYINYPGSDPTQVADAMFKMTANGSGGITGTIAASGYIGSSSTAVNQNITGASYAFNNGAGTITFPASGAANQTLISGTKTLYVSPDGNYAIGGSASGYDLFVAVRAASGTSTNSLYKGLYYTAGVDEDNSDPTSGAYLDTFYGSLSADGAGTIIRHDRIAPFNDAAYNWTVDAYYTLNADGSYDRPSFRYAVGTSGLGVVGIGKGPYEGIFLGVQAPNFSGSGVYLNPAGVVNAASFAPYTTGIARGELITLFGSNLAPSLQVAQALPFPTTLNGVQVKINGRLAPIYYVSPTQMSVIVPYPTELQDFAQIQVTNGSTTSNAVTVFMNTTMPGVFSLPQTGVGNGAVLHADFSVVNAAKPAKKGETVLVYLTGLGDVNPPVTEGNAGPTNPLSTMTNDLQVFIDGIEATVSYAGLAPGLAGLYQINVQVPSDASTGNVYIDISTPDAYTSQVTIPVQ